MNRRRFLFLDFFLETLDELPHQRLVVFLALGDLDFEGHGPGLLVELLFDPGAGIRALAKFSFRLRVWRQDSAHLDGRRGEHRGIGMA